MVSSCSILFTDFGTVFVFALGWFFAPSVFFCDLGGFPPGSWETADGVKGRPGAETKTVSKSVNKLDQLEAM